ncbi:MAG TPA: diacylglycerol kinase family protein, partial [Verrucomicrobiae bacterium]
MRVGVVINQEARGARDVAVAREALAEFAGHGIEAKVVVGPGRVVAAAARGLLAEGVDALVAGGGDGTVSAVAEICVR